MKKVLIFYLTALVFSLAAPLGASQTFAPFSLSLGLTGRGVWGGEAGLAFAGGIGASLTGDWRPVKWISLGTGLAYTEFPGDKAWRVATWDVGVKLLPFGAGAYGEWYFHGTLGWNLLRHTLDSATPGTYHAGWGIGYRVFLGPGMALDLCPGYDLYTPFHEASLHSLGVKAGLTWFLGGKDHPSGSRGVDKS